MNKNDFKYYLNFRLDFYEDKTGLWEFVHPKEYSEFSQNGKLSRDDTEREIRKYIYHALGLKLYSNAWTEIELTESSTKKFIDTLETFQQKKIAYIGSAGFSEWLTSEAAKQCEWFTLNTEDPDPYDNSIFRFDRGYPVCKAYKYPPLLDIQRRTFVSEKFKNIIEKEGLTGLEFLWIQDIGKYAPKQQWYAAIAANSIGNGFDHPWFDLEAKKKLMLGAELERLVELLHSYASPDKLKERQLRLIEETYSGTYRKGTTSFDIGAIATGKPQDKNLQKLLSFCPKFGYEGSISTVPRFLKTYLPDTDFAYWDGTELCFNSKAKDILLQHNLINEKQLIPLIIYDQLPDNCEDLDTGKATPPPLLTTEQLEKFRDEEVTLKQAYDLKTLPVRVPTMKNALSLLRQLKREQMHQFAKGISKKNLEKKVNERSTKLPEHWLNVLVITNGGEFGVEDSIDCVIVPIDEIDVFNQEYVDLLKSSEDDYVDSYTYFATNFCGDTYAFEKKSAQHTEDSTIVLISHEDYSIERRWNGVADFLESLLLGI